MPVKHCVLSSSTLSTTELLKSDSSFNENCNEQKVTNTSLVVFANTNLLETSVKNINSEKHILKNDFNASYIQLNSVCKEENNLDANSSYDLLKIENQKKIQEMAKFDENWNGVGGQVFSTNSIDLFIKIIDNIYKQPSIAPTGRNSLFMEYKLDDQSVLAFEVRENRVEMVLVPNGDYSKAICQIFEEDFIQQINLQVKKFYGFE